jgi:hypothetical protein
VTDQLSIRRILDHLGLPPLENDKPRRRVRSLATA